MYSPHHLRSLFTTMSKALRSKETFHSGSHRSVGVFHTVINGLLSRGGLWKQPELHSTTDKISETILCKVDALVKVKIVKIILLLICCLGGDLHRNSPRDNMWRDVTTKSWKRGCSVTNWRDRWIYAAKPGVDHCTTGNPAGNSSWGCAGSLNPVL